MHQGYTKVATDLEQASNVRMEEPRVSQFRNEVLAGNFEDVPTMVATFVRGSATFCGEEFEQIGQNEIMRQKREFMLKE